VIVNSIETMTRFLIIMDSSEHGDAESLEQVCVRPPYRHFPALDLPIVWVLELLDHNGAVVLRKSDDVH
jgi:hypothetical protein